jgi:hypothetical protein
MMEKQVLIATLGNRDLQIRPNSTMTSRLFDCFEKGAEDSGAYLVIKKRRDSSFLDNSKVIFEHFDLLKDQVSFPMVEAYLKQFEVKPSVVLVSTEQSPLDPQDCTYVAQFLCKKLEIDGYNVDFYPLTCPPVEFASLVDEFTMLYQGYRDHGITVGNSGGTPDMRAASHAAGFFRGIQFLTINARTGQSSLKNYEAQEALVLGHAVNKMLDNFDYSGISKLPLANARVKQLAEYALARAAMDFSTANEIANDIEESTMLVSISTLKQLEREMWINAKIKFQQRSYADYLWRLYAIRDNLESALLEEKLNISLLPLYETDSENKYSNWNNFLEANSELKIFLSKEKLGDKELIYYQPRKEVFSALAKFYDIQSLAKGINYKFKKIRDLRNAVAHNYKGISLAIIEAEIDVAQFNNDLGNYTKLNKGDFGIFSIINTEIKKYLKI